MRSAFAALTLLLAAPLAQAAAPAPRAQPPAAGPGHAAPAAAPHAPAAPPAPAADAIVLFPALGRATQVIVTGRVLGAAAPGSAARATPRGLQGAAVEVTLGGQSRRVVSVADGFFEATFATTAERPLAVGPRAAQARSGAVTAEGAVQVVEDGAPFLLVIEADDLVGLVSRRGEPGEEEAQVPAMAALLRCIGEGTHPAVGTVAVTAAGGERSARLLAALAEGGFPFVGVLARPPAPRGAAQLAALRALLSAFPHRVMLLGDAGGQAPERFAALRDEFPGRVIAVYVRGRATRAGDPRFEEVTLFTDPLRAAGLAAERGLADRACVERALAPPDPPAPAVAAPSQAGTPATSPAACPPCPCAVPPADSVPAPPPGR
jgi:hypothetical protein